jgi:hypothetical protein
MIICGHCGRENVDEAINCFNCGTVLNTPETVNESEPTKKSKAVAVTLALIFGPLGLLYLGIEGFMVVLAVVGLGFFLLPLIAIAVHGTGIGLLISLLARVAAAWWAIKAVDRRNNFDSDGSEANDLLDEATKLESVDLALAIAKYEELVSLHPGTRPAIIAANCLKTLRASRH